MLYARSRTEECILTKTTGQMYEGNRVWSLKAPPSHSGFTLDAHLLWSYNREESQKHKNCGRHPSVRLSLLNTTSTKSYSSEGILTNGLYWLFDRSYRINKLSLCISEQDVFNTDTRDLWELWLWVFDSQENSKSALTPRGSEVQWQVKYIYEGLCIHVSHYGDITVSVMLWFVW